MPKVISTVMQDIGVSTGAYTANDALGGLGSFDVPKQGVIMGLVVIDRDSEDDPFDIVLFDRTFTATADKDVAVFSDADLDNSLGHLVVLAADYINFNANSMVTLDNIGLAYETETGTLFYQCVTRATPTYTATSDLQFKLLIVVG